MKSNEVWQMEHSPAKVMSRNFARYYEILENEMVSNEQKQLTKMAFILVNKRIEKNMNQDEIVKRSGLSKSVVSRMESFNTIPSSITLVKYASALGMELILVDSESIKGF